MSLAKLGIELSRQRARMALAHDQVNDMSELLAQWFLDSNEGAREFLIEVAKMWREECLASTKVGK